MFHLKGDHTTGWEVLIGDIAPPVATVKRAGDGLFKVAFESACMFDAGALKELSMKLQYINGRWPQQTWFPEDDDLPF